MSGAMTRMGRLLLSRKSWMNSLRTISRMRSQLILIASQKVGKVCKPGRLRNKLQRQGAQVLRNEAYFFVGREPAPAKAGEGCSVTPHMDFLRSRSSLEPLPFQDDNVQQGQDRKH